MSRKSAVYTPAVDRLHDLIEEARWVLTEDEKARLSPVSSPEEIEKAIRQIQYGMLNEESLRDNDPFSPARLPPDWLDKPDLTLLRCMRNPEFFGFTCWNLFRLPDGKPLRLMPFQAVVLHELWHRQMPMLVASRGAGKSFILALFLLLKLTFCQGTQVVVVSRTLRQSKVIFEYVSRFWNSSPVFRSLVGPGQANKNGPRNAMSEGRYEFFVGDSVALFLPLGPDGEGIRGIRAQVVIADEFGSISPEVYSVVVAGFGAVAGDPVYKAGEHARADILKRLGLWTPQQEQTLKAVSGGNQSIIAGTATYQFNHFYKYYQSYREIINSRGDPKELERIFQGPPPAGFDWRRYSVIRLPWTSIPHGYMDEATIGRAKQLSTTSEYFREYEAVFSADSDGFFRRSLIEKCTVGQLGLDPPAFPSGVADFTVPRKGDPLRQYVFGIDPALERDHFAVVVIELWPDHQRVVHVWTTKKSDHRRREKRGGVAADFYAFAAAHLRDLFARFPPRSVVIDAQGGGGALIEKLREPGEGEVGYFVTDDDTTAHLPGEHIIRPFQFANANDTGEANWTSLKGLETRTVLFPRCSAVEFALAEAADQAAGTDEDGLVDTLHEIEELKNELTTIVLTQSTQGTRERWDVPGGTTAHVRKDRYSAWVMATWMARKIGQAVPTSERPEAYGGAVAELAGRKRDEDPSSSLYVLTEACDPKIRAKARGSWYGG